MKRVLLNICLLVYAILPLCAQESLSLFSSENFEARYYHAVRLNNSGQYMAAYDAYKKLHNDMLATIAQNDYSPSLIPDNDDFKLYLNVISDQAECAYKLNFGKEILSLFDEHVKAYNDRFDHDMIKSWDFYSQIANFYKIRGDYYYLEGTKTECFFTQARSDYKEAIKNYELAFDLQAKVKVLIDLAQMEYTRGNYYDALGYIEKARMFNNTRRGSGSNAETSFSDEANQELNLILNSAYAMCLARMYSEDNPLNFRKALNTINGLISQLPKRDKHLPALQRTKAKLLLLQHDKNGSDIQDAASLYAEYFKSVKEEVNSNFLQMTADQREEYWMVQRQFVVDSYLLENRNPGLLYDVTLYNKGMLLEMSHSFDDLLYDGTKKGTVNEKMSLNALRQQDALNAMNGEKTSLAEAKEKELLEKMRADGRYKKFFTPLSHTWKEVQKVLPTNGCSIEFVEYEKLDSMYFGALVLKKIGKPKFVHICNADQLAAYCIAPFLQLKTLMKSTDGSAKNAIYESEYISDTIWNEDLISAIGNSEKIYFAADGYLHQLAIEYMLPKPLQDKKFYRLSSTRVLVDGNKIDAKKIRNGAAFVLGGIVYDSSIDKDNHNDRGNDAEAFNKLQERGSSFSYMKGAKVECDSIIFYRNNPDDLYLDSLKATEQAFYENCRNYPILHISTHGTFSGDKAIRNELLGSSSKDVLSESVMALSNAGTHLRDKQFDAFNKDGLISAREIARLNLSNVEFVTTSACQTALGYITADGIYGMQRGFKSAGVKGMVLSLWSVNVESARIFFTTLYKYLAEGESVHKAFHHARNDLLTKTFTTLSTTNKFSVATLSSKESIVNKTKKYNTPQHTNPYILVDVWE